MQSFVRTFGAPVLMPCPIQTLRCTYKVRASHLTFLQSGALYAKPRKWLCKAPLCKWQVLYTNLVTFFAKLRFATNLAVVTNRRECVQSSALYAFPPLCKGIPSALQRTWHVLTKRSFIPALRNGANAVATFGAKKVCTNQRFVCTCGRSSAL